MDLGFFVWNVPNGLELFSFWLSVLSENYSLTPWACRFVWFFVLSEVSLPNFWIGQIFPGSLWDLTFLSIWFCYYRWISQLTETPFLNPCWLTVHSMCSIHLLLVSMILLRILYGMSLASLGDWRSLQSGSPKNLSLPITSAFFHTFTTFNLPFNWKYQRQKYLKTLEWETMQSVCLMRWLCMNYAYVIFSYLWTVLTS